MSFITEQIEDEFTTRFGEEYLLVGSPGRVNLIGEHTDYNRGFVLPAAIDKNITLALAPNDTDTIRVYALDKQSLFKVKLNDHLERSGQTWPDYILGIVDQLQKRGYEIEGFDCVFGGDVPIGAGMSSSAALEGGAVFGLNQLFGFDISLKEMAKIAQQAENEFVGVQCGIMDQFVSLNARENHAMLLDCRSLEHSFYRLQHNGLHIVVCDTQVRRELASSEYNVRRQQCEQGVKLLQRYDDSIESLRDVSLELLQKHSKEFDPKIYNRCCYVVEENQRVLNACNDLENNKSFESETQWLVGVAYILSRNFSIQANYNNRYGLGGGLLARF